MRGPQPRPSCATFQVELRPGELSLLRAWIAACHEASPSRSHIKDEGFLGLDDDLSLLSVVSDAGVAPGADTLAAVSRITGAFLERLEACFPEEHRSVRERSRRLQFNVLSYRPVETGGVASGVPYHSDRVPTTILFGLVITRAIEGGALEVLDLDSGTTTCLVDEGWAVIFDDRRCLHRVHDMKGPRQALTLRVW